jgi:hypothetical protein
MESGLKKIWTRQRRKSRSSPSVQDHHPQFELTTTYEGHVSGPAPQFGSLPVKPSQVQASTTQSRHKKSKSEGLQEFRRPGNGNTDVRPKSVGGIQPVLVGISRPATATSLSKAVSQVADNVAQGRLNTENTIAAVGAAREKGPKARYVDIFQITARSQGLVNKYNEDVAVRNLDVRRVALSSSANNYDPGSKFQEEVAIRNTSAEMSHKPLDTSTHSQDDTRSSHESPPAVTPVVHNNYQAIKHDLVAGDCILRTGQALEHQHAQQPRMTAKALAPQLPAIPQEPQAEASEVLKDLGGRGKHSTREKQPQSPFVDQKEQRGQTNYGAPHLKDPWHPNRRSRALPNESTTKANVSRPLMKVSARSYNDASSATQDSTPCLSSYSVLPAERSRPELRLDQSKTSKQSAKRDDRRDDRRHTDEALVSETTANSMNSSPSLKETIHLSNQIIMDLTSNDSGIFSDPAIMTNPPEQSPDITDSKVDRHQIVTEKQYFDLAAIDEPLRAKFVEEAIRENTRQQDDLSKAKGITPQASAPNMTFSKIKTMASTSPRPSIMSSSVPSMASQSDSEKIEGILQTSNLLPEVSGQVSNAIEIPTDWQPPFSSPSIANGAPQFRNQNKLSLLDEDVSGQIAEVENREHQSQHISTRSFPASPESLVSNDPVHPSTTSGVHTCDLANIPSSSAMSEQSSRAGSRQISKSLGKKHVNFTSNDISGIFGRSGQLSVSKSTEQWNEIPTPENSSTFDEDLARKQIQVRAALRRLQKSLEESDFQEDSDTQSTFPSKRYLAAPGLTFKAGTNVPTSIYTSNKRPASSTKIHNYNEPPKSTEVSSHIMATLPSPALSKPGSPQQFSRFSNESGLDDSYEYTSSFVTRLTPIRQVFEGQTVPPVSPSDISLSSFPLPFGSPQHIRQASMQRPSSASRNSQKSISSIASAFSIPYHMIPRRSSSIRDYDDGFSLDQGLG